MKELWKDIQGYEGLYQVSNLGSIKSLSRKAPTYHRGVQGFRVTSEKILKQCCGPNGYNIVNLRKNNTSKVYAVHVIVATHFIPNPENLSEINHRNENKQDNSAANLEWCTHKYNMNYGTTAKRIGNSNKGKTRSLKQRQTYSKARTEWWKKQNSSCFEL